MHCIRVDRPKWWDRCHLYVIGDLHRGDPHSNYRLTAQLVKQIENDPIAIVAIIGDIMNTATAGSKSDFYSEILSPDEQVDDAVALLLPIRDKIVCIIPGNHEHRIAIVSGIDTMRYVATKLGCLDYYDPDGLFAFIRFGTSSDPRTRGRPQWYTFYATHGTGGGKKVGAKANGLEDMAAIVDADIYIQGHTHQPLAFPQAFYRVSASNSTVVEVDKLFVNAPAMLDYGGYSQQGRYKPASKQCPVIILHGAIKQATEISNYKSL
jgi:predicted phosphodiesterase